MTTTEARWNSGGRKNIKFDHDFIGRKVLEEEVTLPETQDRDARLEC